MEGTMKTRNIYLLLIVLCLTALLNTNPVMAQQIPNFSLYNMNHYLVNPAATGITDRMPVSLSYRKIWAGMTNAPSVQYLSANTKVAPEMGVGARIFNFQAGPLRKTGPA